MRTFCVFVVVGKRPNENGRLNVESKGNHKVRICLFKVFFFFFFGGAGGAHTQIPLLATYIPYCIVSNNLFSACTFI